MNHEPNQPAFAPDGGTPQEKQTALIARRRLLRGGLGIAPVLMVSAPRSVMAGDCTTCSAFGSINTSDHTDTVYTCSGKTPAFWMDSANHSSWPSSYVAVGSGLTGPTSFDGALGCTSIYAGKTLLQVLSLSATSGSDCLASYIAASLLNAAKGLAPATVLSVGNVKDVWRAYVRKGWYEPTGGVKWYADSSKPVGTGGITQWLKSTMS